MNLQVVNGSGTTRGPGNSLGNVIIGYNQKTTGDLDIQTGSHNLVVGDDHTFSRDSAVVAGHNNAVTGFYASVTGGASNVAAGNLAFVGAGSGNVASGDTSSVAGGILNTASGPDSHVGGGQDNTASGGLSFVGGGAENVSSGPSSAVTGGLFNSAAGRVAMVGGGRGHYPRLNLHPQSHPRGRARCRYAPPARGEPVQEGT